MTSKFIQYRLLLILLATVAACILLSLSWPRLRASVHYLPVDTAISNYWKTREVNHAQLDGLVNRAAESITIHDHYRYWEGQSELLILRGQDMNRSFWERREALEKSIATCCASYLPRAPGPFFLKWRSTLSNNPHLRDPAKRFRRGPPVREHRWII